MPLDAVVADLPLRLGGGAAVGAAPSDVDVLIDRIPFWLGIRQDTPYQRETAPYQREQIDQQPESGEQSLAGWWTRSQMSFHYGAGLDYLDTTARPQPEDRLRFKTSRNVNVWEPGKVTRLNGTSLARSASATETLWCVAADGLLVAASSSKVETWNGTTWSTLNRGSTNPVRAFASTASTTTWRPSTASGRARSRAPRPRPRCTTCRRRTCRCAWDGSSSD
jgi:hypothetical protein